ncbi:unnamed protein product [Ceratitis capitata]|uniref:(Mediterranean fruit fly) hypothetical protein n=1 Tax=Ceratitis capitata TaxID=7213 RepID=A0A811V4Y9_CERCA|nr:unnamed protein product [Ceratitis capitata]
MHCDEILYGNNEKENYFPFVEQCDQKDKQTQDIPSAQSGVQGKCVKMRHARGAILFAFARRQLSER